MAVAKKSVVTIPMAEIPNLQPETTTPKSSGYYRLKTDEYPASALPMIARRKGMPGNALPYLITLALVTPVLVWTFINLNSFACSIPFGLVLIVFGVLIPWGKQMYGSLAGDWMEWSIRHKDCICLDCGEPLTSEPSTGTCPACTQPYSHESCQWGWRRWRNDEDLEDTPPARPGPLLPTRPCRSILTGAPRGYRMLLLIESQYFIYFVLGYWVPMSLVRTLFQGMNPMFQVAIVTLILAMMWWLFTQAFRRGRAQGTAADFKLCPQCGYHLGDRDARGTCPECGFLYTFANCTWAWRFIQKSRKKKDLPPTPPPLMMPPESDNASIH